MGEREGKRETEEGKEMGGKHRDIEVRGARESDGKRRTEDGK